MGKCAPCSQNKCKGDYELRDYCEGKDGSCSCTCQESKAETFWKATGSIAGGVACVAGGVALTVMTGGLGAIFGGGSLIGAGSSLITNPIAKQITGERMNIGDLATDVVVGSTIGAVSGGLGAGGSALTKGAATAVRVGVQVGAGATAGVAGGAISETARAVKGEDVSVESFAKSMAIGGACGIVGGASGQVANAASNGLTSGVAKATTRVAVQTASAAATDATIQAVQTGEVDVKRVLLTAATAATVSTTSEITRSTAMRSDTFVERKNADLVKEAKTASGQEIPEEVKVKIEDSLNKANKLLTPETVEKQMEKVQQYPKVRDELKLHQDALKGIKDGSLSPNWTPKENDVMTKRVGRQIDIVQKRATQLRPDKLGGANNLHFLHGEERVGQVAMDIPDQNGNRGLQRVIADVQDGGKVVFADFIDDHDYSKACKPGERMYENPKVPVVPNQELLNKKRRNKGEKGD